MNIERININDRGIPSPGFTGSETEFTKLEKDLKAEIPESYRQLIRSADGGHPELCYVVPDADDPDNAFDVDRFYAIANPEEESIFEALRTWSKIIGKKALPIGRDGGDNQIYLDLAKQGSVWIYLTDEKARVKLADSIEQLVDGLSAYPE